MGYLLIEHVSLDANFATDVLAGNVLRVLLTVEADRTQPLVVEFLLKCFFCFLIRCAKATSAAIAAVDRACANLLAYRQGLQVCKHMHVVQVHIHLLLISRLQRIQHHLHQSAEKTRVERAHAIDQICQAVELDRFVAGQWHLLLNHIEGLHLN